MTPLLAAAFFTISPAALTPLMDRAAPDAEYLVIDIRTREVLASRWPDYQSPIPLGSLVKPFTALAYHGNFPEYECHGGGTCWLKRGHGRLNFTQALAESCNSYFLQLAEHVDARDIQRIAAKYHLPVPAIYSPGTLIGLGTDWQISPLALTRAYAELSQRSGEPVVAQILRGMAEGARTGTSSAIHSGALAKTGTARCLSNLHHTTDGYTLVLEPADAPRIALLVRVHNVPGAAAAKTAARILSIIRTGK